MRKRFLNYCNYALMFCVFTGVFANEDHLSLKDSILHPAEETNQIMGDGSEWALPDGGIPNAHPTVTVPDSLTFLTCVADSLVLTVDVSDPDPNDEIVVNFYGRPKRRSVAPFTLIGLPDTQYYTGMVGGGTNAIFKSQTNWIVANKDALNIAHTMHLGDCVEGGDNGGNDIEWRRADTAMGIIEDPATTHIHDGMSYTMCVGNHDQSPFGDANGTSIFYNQFFGANRFAGRYYWGGNYGHNADNNFQLFSASDIDFIVISLEYDNNANPNVIAWADSLLKAHSNRQGIIVSHFLISRAGYFGVQGSAIYNGLKDNSNLFLMLSGHIAGEGVRSITYQGKTVHTLLADYQDRANGGDGWMRIMEIDPWKKTMHVKTYSPWLNQYETDANSQFTLSNLNIPGDTTPFVLMHTDTLVGSGMASYAWGNLPLDTAYQWYVAVSDGKDTVVSAVSEFSTVNGSTQSKIICRGDSVLLGGAYQSVPGKYVDKLTGSDGCDSILTTMLSIKPDSGCVVDPASKNCKTVSSDGTWMKSNIVTTATANSYPWPGVNGLPAANTFTEPVVLSQPYPWVSIATVEGSEVIKAESGVTYYRKEFTLSDNTDLSVRFRMFVDDNMQIFINGQWMALEDDMGPENFKTPNHDVLFNKDGTVVNGNAGGDAYDFVTNTTLDNIYQVGINEIILTIRNRTSKPDLGGFSFRMDIDQNGNPVIVKSGKTTPSAPGAVSNALAFNIDLYPNPAKGVVNITALSVTQQSTLEIVMFDLNGKIVLNQSYSKPVIGENIQLDLSSFAKGVYSIRAQSGGEFVVKRVVLN